jgi:Skp family chaperone for outer membrane proteins
MSTPAPELGLLDALNVALDTPATPQAEAPTTPEPKTVAAPEAVKAEPAKTDAKAEATPSKVLENKLDIPDDVLEAIGKEPEAAKEEATPELPKEATKSAQTAFAKVTTELRDTKAKLAALESKINKETTKVEDSGEETSPQLDILRKELETLKAERDEYESELSVARVQATKQYKVAIDAPIREATNTIQEMAKMYEMDADAVVRAAAINDPAQRRAAVKEMLAGLDPIDAVDVRRRVDELNSLYNKRDLILTNAEKAMEEISKRELAQQVEQTRQQELAQKKAQEETTNTYSEMWNRFTQEVPILKKTGNAEWDARVDGLREQAMLVEQSDLDTETRAALTYQAVAMPLMVQLFQGYVKKSQGEIAGLKKALGEYRTATPGAGGGDAKTGSPELASDVSFLDALEKGLR